MILKQRQFVNIDGLEGRGLIRDDLKKQRQFVNIDGLEGRGFIRDDLKATAVCYYRWSGKAGAYAR